MSNELSTAIQELAPDGLSPRPGSPQEQKSSKTRETILEAALDCLAEHGYANTTHNLVCQQAKVSRGALLHHYPTSQDLMVAVIDYAFYKHMTTFSQMVGSLSDESRRNRNTAIAIDWQQCQSREMQVYLEMKVAARTNSELRAIFLPRARHHDLVWKEELLKVFPEWRDNMPKLDLTRRLTRAILEGLSMSRELSRDSEAEWALITFTAEMVLKIRQGELDFPPPERVEAFKQAVSANVKRPRSTASKPARRPHKNAGD
ncbi:TetR/AcrR family transcriptional regulator [Noviherbaspirillum sedimenti]|uniref:TetR/AcrR family transcriptional regulator n=1 Tax=Noviherbaspirillum sedimenti TaxID=2320865 RepID=A0A3A3G9C5_9BURK|nr:TetR/AcrR family transcriptional regulator [Noviherbaspirillum sedimenti]RJG03349.1 TetR/AcrR family transcriptional regulator [Noviherbaspirillum sedimenti]